MVCYFFVLSCDQIILNRIEWDRLHNDNNEEYTKYNRKIDGYCGLCNHLLNIDILQY